MRSRPVMDATERLDPQNFGLDCRWVRPIRQGGRTRRASSLPGRLQPVYQSVLNGTSMVDVPKDKRSVASGLTSRSRLSRAKVVRHARPRGHFQVQRRERATASRRHVATDERPRAFRLGGPDALELHARAMCWRLQSSRHFPAGETDDPARCALRFRGRAAPTVGARPVRALMPKAGCAGLFSNRLRVTASSGARPTCSSARFMTSCTRGPGEPWVAGSRSDRTSPRPRASDGISETARAASVQRARSGASGDGAVPGRGAGARKQTDLAQCRCGRAWSGIDAGRADRSGRAGRAVSATLPAEDFIVGESNRLAATTPQLTRSPRTLPGAGEAGVGGVGRGGVGAWGRGGRRCCSSTARAGWAKTTWRWRGDAASASAAGRERLRPRAAGVHERVRRSHPRRVGQAARTAGRRAAWTSSGVTTGEVDLLVIDDGRQLANKQATQAELLHVREIARAQAQVVLVSDQHPRSSKFSPQLISPVPGGHGRGIAPPDEDLTRPTDQDAGSAARAGDGRAGGRGDNGAARASANATSSLGPRNRGHP